MYTLSYNGLSWSVDHAVKGSDFINAYDADNTIIVSFLGITDFNDFVYTGEYMSPTECFEEQCNDVKLVGSSLKTRDGRSVSAGAVGATKIVRLWKGSSGTFEPQTLSIGAFNGYSHIGIVPTFHASGDRRIPMLFLNSGGSKGGYICGLSSDSRVSRLISDVDASAGTITFGTGYKDGVADNKAAYPYLILGFL